MHANTIGTIHHSNWVKMIVLCHLHENITKYGLTFLLRADVITRMFLNGETMFDPLIIWFTHPRRPDTVL